MNSIPHIIEAALLLLVTFLIGCVIGWILRAKIFKSRPAKGADSGKGADISAPATTSSVAPLKSVPETPKSEVSKPDISKPDISKSDVSKSDVSKSKVVKSDVPGQEASVSSTPKKPQKPKSSKPTIAAVPVKPVVADEKPAQEPTPEPTSADAKPTELTEAGAKTQKPAALREPRGGKGDDLKKIKGVGPKLENTLNGLGIYHFDQIAQWSRNEIDWVDDYLSFKGRIDRDEWIAQAEKLKD